MEDGVANTDAPFGLVEWTGTLSSGAYPSATVIRQVAYNDSTPIYSGDPVKNLATGYVSQWTAATEVSQLAGIFVGCKYKSTSLGRTVWSPYWPGTDVASTEKVYAYLLPVDMATPLVLKVQTDSTGITIADIGANADVALGTGSTVTGRSGAYLNHSTYNTTATLPFKIIGLWGDYAPPGVNGAASGAYAVAIVAANSTGSTGLTT